MVRFIYVVVAAVVLLGAARAEACDCLTAEPTRAEALVRADTVFEGRALGTSGGFTTFLVERGLRGAAAGDRVVVGTDGSSCGYRFSPGDRAMIFAPRVNGRLRVAQCDPKIPSRVEIPAASAPGATCACTGVVGAATGTLEAVDGRVKAVRVDARHRWITVRVRGGTRTILTPADTCGVSAKVGARIRVRGEALGGDTLAVGACAAGTSLRPR